MIDLGPYKANNIYCGECVAMMARLPDDSIDLVVTSPPYDNVDEDMVTHCGKGLRDYEGYEWDFVSVADQLGRVMKPGGVVVWVVGDATVDGSETGSSFRQALWFKRVGFRLETMIYQTDKPPMNDRRYQANFEFMFVLSKGKLGVFNPIMKLPTENTIKRKRNKVNKSFNRGNDGAWKPVKSWNKTITETIRGNVWYIKSCWGSSDRVATDTHPAIFPESLARDHIISWTNPGAIVLDPFAGSGTTAKMAIETGRDYLGFEISQKYVDLAKRRIQSARIPLPGINL